MRHGLLRRRGEKTCLPPLNVHLGGHGVFCETKPISPYSSGMLAKGYGKYAQRQVVISAILSAVSQDQLESA